MSLMLNVMVIDVNFNCDKVFVHEIMQNYNCQVVLFNGS